MIKNNCKYLAIVLLVAWSIGLRVGYSMAGNITDSASQISVNTGKLHVVMEKGSEYSDSYLVVGGSGGHDSYFDGSYGMIPMAKVSELTKRYGNFLRCNNPGANEGKQSAQSCVFIAADKQAKKQMEALDNIITSGVSKGNPQYPVIKISAVKLRVIKFNMIVNGEEMPIEANMNSMTHLLVKGIEIINNDYSIK